MNAIPLTLRYFSPPASDHTPEGVEFGVHPLPGDALVLGFEFFVGLLVGGKKLPELKEVGQESFGEEYLPGSRAQSRDSSQLSHDPFPDLDLLLCYLPPNH